MRMPMSLRVQLWSFWLNTASLWLVCLAGCAASSAPAGRDPVGRLRARLQIEAPSPEQRSVLRQALEREIYRQAVVANRPLGYRRYLQLYPQGSFVDAARQSLATLLLQRARSEAQLLRIATRFVNTSAAQQALARLAPQMAQRAISSVDPRVQRRFLTRFADHPAAAAVRQRLATLALARADQDPRSLERTIDHYRGTSAADRARLALCQGLAKRAIGGGINAWRRLKRLARGRYPSLVADVAKQIAIQRVDLALARLDLAELARLKRAHPALPQWQSGGAALALARCASGRCVKLLSLARRAGPWRPPVPIDELRRQLLNDDYRIAWLALGQLAYLPEVGALETIFEAGDSVRLPMVWAATVALRRFVAHAAGRADHLIEDALFGATTSAEVVTPWRVFLRARGAAEPLRRVAVERLREFARQDRRRLAVCYLAHLLLPGDRETSKRLVAALADRLTALVSAWPEMPTGSPRLVAQRLLDEALVLQLVLADLQQGGSPSERLSADLTKHVARWRTQLANASSIPSLDVSPQRQHAAERVAAMQQLARRRDPLARAVYHAICRISRDGRFRAICLASSQTGGP